MCKARENIGQIEIMIRFYITIFFTVVAMSLNNYMILVLPIIIIYTAIKRKCFFYSIFGINKDIDIIRYYQSLLRVNNPSPVVVFDNDGEILFENEKSKNELDYIKQIKDLKIPKKHRDYKNNNKDFEFYFLHENKKIISKIEIKYLHEEGLVLVYFTDVSQIKNLNEEIEKT